MQMYVDSSDLCEYQIAIVHVNKLLITHKLKANKKLSAIYLFIYT